jgi:hypothetical protein
MIPSTTLEWLVPKGVFPDMWIEWQAVGILHWDECSQKEPIRPFVARLFVE